MADNKKHKKTEKTTKKSGRGVKISAKVKAKALVMLMSGDTMTYIHEQLGIGISTIATWKKALNDSGEFENIRNNILKEQWDKYLLDALGCQETALEILGMKLENALTAEKNRKVLFDGIVKLSEGESGEALKRNLNLIQSESIGDIARVFGLMTEKVAVMSGKATHNLNLNGEVKLKFEDFNDFDL